ncbi:hypothetical protein HKX48_001239 [Thoreauomyces humboldtii]|nr:hypothetical protein HKX48_001239 [Thoreauomyces humboldtii]
MASSPPPPTTITIRVPASTSNIGPGFDVLGAALSMYLVVTAKFLPPSSQTTDTVITYTGNNPHTVPLVPKRNLITQTAIYIAKAHDTALPLMHVHIDNPIPLGRGLGSSGSAVVAGVILANEACGLGMSRERIMDWCLVFEGHPDNVGASLFGGFSACYLSHSVAEAHSQCHSINLDDKVPLGQGASLPHPPAESLGRHVRVPMAPSIRCVVVVPRFELSTKLARSVLPDAYPRADVVHNLQRLAVLVLALSADPPCPKTLRGAMQDRVHQHYRQHLVPGLPQILELTPEELPGLLGICVSGAGPTVLALAVGGFEEIGRKIQEVWNGSVAADGTHGIESEVMVLDVVEEGATWNTVKG